ncbi:MAG: cytidine deaminase [Metamycoplasmataceae bacterium]
MINHLNKLSEKAYCPYSNFKVACILETKDKQLIEGVNVENVSYPNSMCAEKGAIANAILNNLNFKNVIKVHIFSPNSDEFLSPCGSCRQNLVEHLNYDVEILMYSKNGKFISKKLSELIPFKVDLEMLKVKNGN